VLLDYYYSAMPEAERYQQYEVLRRGDGSLWELGRGAMGITYKAYDTNLRCAVALKVINSTYLQSDTARQRFLREARAAAALRHPNVATVFNLGTDQGNYFYVMEFIDGETVEDCVKHKGRLEPADALHITLQVSRALAAAAKQRLVHRDLKPSNLMLVDEEGERIVKVIDFGLAKSAKDAGEDTAALTVGGFVGTPHFASPEQVEEGDLDIRSDIYSLGATLYFMVAGKAPFSGSVGQVMSQHLYKPINIEPLTNVPRCVVSLIQRMLEKDRNQRPQTPRDLQNAIVDCLEEIRGQSTRGAVEEPPEPLNPGILLGRNYRLIEELRESPQARHFLADDLRRKRFACLLILRQELVSDPHWFALLEGAVERLRNAPHPMLRAIYSLERAGGYSVLVEEHVVGPSLLDLLRSRSVLSAPEVVRLLSLLAPLADYASAKQLEHIDLTLQGIHFVIGESTASETQPDLLRRSLTAWERIEPKVNAIDFSFAPSQAGTLTGMETLTQNSAGAGPRGSCVRSLSLLAYELLGGPRSRVEATGRYNPIAALTRDGNAVLRRGLIDEISSATELANQLTTAAGIRESTASTPERREPERSELVAASTPERREPERSELVAASTAHTTSGTAHTTSGTKPVTPEPLPRSVLPEAPADVQRKHIPTVSAWRLILAIGFIAAVGIGGYLLYLGLNQNQEIVAPSQEIASLSVRTEPHGASILLDGKSPQAPPNTFTHIPFGTHQLTATLDNYEPIKQDVEVRRGMPPEINLKLKPSQEIAALSVQSEPPGASILLDGKPPQTPNIFTHVPFGTHQLTATLNDYEPIKQNLEVSRGIVPEVHLKLKPSQEIAALSVQSDPPGASILLDGKPPQTPNTFTHVPFGTHQLTAALNDYEPIKQEIEVRRGMTPELHLRLKQSQEIAALSVQSDPPSASVLLDGKPPQGPANTFTHVPFGTHQLTAALDNYEPIRQDLEVRRGMAPEIHLKLKQSQDIAALSVQSDPPGAVILLDGKPPSGPSNSFAHVPFGTHQLTAALDNYESIKQDVEIRHGMNPEIRLKLKKKTDPIADLVAETKKYDQSSPQYLTAYVRLVQFATTSKAANSKEYVDELGRIIERLRTKAPPIGRNEFSLSFKESTKDAANLDILPAILWLAENEKGNEAVSLFLRAANLGDSYAMMRIGRVYLNKGTPSDDDKAFGWFKRAYETPNPNLDAGAYLGACYLSGRGTKKDVRKAEEIIIPLANRNVVSAMTIAGNLLEYRAADKQKEAELSTTPLKRKQPLNAEADELDREAGKWYERAAAKGDWNASARLGRFYENGWGGLEKSDEEAEKRYQEGVKQANPLSMFFYGQFLIEKKPDRRSEAETLISQAASAGVPSAIKWCKENKVNFTEETSGDDHQ
jgi:serine/threonine protein kinase/TPR repeat protein